MVTKANSASVVNESFVPQNGLQGLAKDTSPACLISTILVSNATANFREIDAANYTTTGCSLNFVGTDTTANNTKSAWSVTYSYTYGDTAYVAGNESLVGLGTFGDFIVIIVLALVAMIVIGLIITGFAINRRGR